MARAGRGIEPDALPELGESACLVAAVPKSDAEVVSSVG